MGENVESIYVKSMCAILRVWSCFQPVRVRKPRANYVRHKPKKKIAMRAPERARSRVREIPQLDPKTTTRGLFRDSLGGSLRGHLSTDFELTCLSV